MTGMTTGGLLGDDKGGVVIWLAAGLTVLLGFAALAIDVGYLYALRSHMQNAADAAALAGVSQLPDEVNVDAVALAITEENLPSAEHGTVLTAADVEMGQWDRSTRVFTSGANPPTAVRVTIRRTNSTGNAARTFFAKVMGYDSMDVATQAIATPPQAPACLLALEPSAKEAIMVNSNSSIAANGCRVQVNSSHSEALRTNSGSSITAKEISVTGGFTGGGYSPAPDTGSAPLGDPLAGLAAPPEASAPCDFNDVTYNGGSPTLLPGVYCTKLELNSGAAATLQPGTYVIRDGDFIVNSGSSVTGSGVLIYLTGTNSPEFIINSGSHANLSAPTSGPHAGILIYQDAGVTGGTVHLFNSDAASAFEGTIYLPNGKVMINSGSVISGPAPHTSILTRTMEVNSDSGIVLNSDYKSSVVPLPRGLAGRKTALVQ